MLDSVEATAPLAIHDEELVTRPVRIRHRILIVDDRPENLLAADAALTGLGALIVTARSGEEALKHLLESEYSLVLLDVQMPGMNGYETAQYIRQRPRTAHVPIIFLTAHEGESKNILRAYDLGAVDFMFKPFEAAILKSKAQTLLSLQERTEALARLQVQHELELERQRQQADQLARETAAKLQLAHLNEQLAEADHRKNEFLAILAHELRNPLAPLRALFDLAKQTPDTPLAPRMIEIGDRQLTLLARLVDDLLDVSRITANKIELRPETIDLREIVETAMTTSKPRIADRRHTLVPQISATPIAVTVDSLRIVQVISNLLNNAARYTQPNGRVEIHCGVANERAFVTVKDNGIGIPADLVGTIFDMFVQERVRSDGSGGLGLGLALAKHLVALHGGSISVTSGGRGCGSTFRVELPLAGSPESLRPRTRTSDMEPLVLGPGSGKLRIAIVDDNEDARELVAHMLETAGHEVFLAHDGPSGLETILEHAPDAALIDIGLPGMTGLDVARALKERRPDLPTRLIAFTGYCGPEANARATEAGFHDHLVKPVTMDALLRCLGLQAVAAV
ncbi:MAG: response regulator [Deltaproteobacteria bacterium]|nr:response regulator [Deltaproteobacteria bacterium]